MDKRTHLKFTERLFTYKESFTGSEKIIAAYLLDNYPLSLLQNASEIAASLELNIATVTRFFVKLGYENVKEATKEFKKEIRAFISSPLDRYQDQKIDKFNQLSDFDFVQKTAELDSENIFSTLLNLDYNSLQQASSLAFDNNKKVFIVSAMKSFSLATYLYASLSIFKENVYIYQNTNPSEFMLNFDSDSVCIFFDFRRSSKLIKKISEYTKSRDAKIISISDSKLSPSVILSDYSFIISTKSSTMFDSYTAGLFFINIFLKIMIRNNKEEIYNRYVKLEEVYSHLDVFLKYDENI